GSFRFGQLQLQGMFRLRLLSGFGFLFREDSLVLCSQPRLLFSLSSFSIFRSNLGFDFSPDARLKFGAPSILSFGLLAGFLFSLQHCLLFSPALGLSFRTLTLFLLQSPASFLFGAPA